MHGTCIKIKKQTCYFCFLNYWNYLLKTAYVKKYNFTSVTLRYFAVYCGYRHWVLTSNEAVTWWQHSYWLIGTTDSRRHVLIGCLMTIETMRSEGCGLHEAIELMMLASKCCHRLMRTGLTLAAAVRFIIIGIALQTKEISRIFLKCYVSITSNVGCWLSVDNRVWELMWPTKGNHKTWHHT
jgi:hypothetical protein